MRSFAIFNFSREKKKKKRLSTTTIEISTLISPSRAFSIVRIFAFSNFRIDSLVPPFYIRRPLKIHVLPGNWKDSPPCLAEIKKRGNETTVEPGVSTRFENRESRSRKARPRLAFVNEAIPDNRVFHIRGGRIFLVTRVSCLVIL